MGKILAIVRYEYKMQLRHPATWAILLAATALSLLDNFPSAGNLMRLEFLQESAYFVYRVMSLDALVLLFGLSFLLAGRLPLDGKTGMKALFLSAPLHKGQYVLGKLLGGFLYTFSMLCLFLAVNTAVYFFSAPFDVSVVDCCLPLARAIVCCALPVSVFVGVGAVALPGMMDIRLFYLLAAVVFGYNAAYVGSAEAMPFYLLTGGDLVRCIWMHPAWPAVELGSVLANGAFLVGGGLAVGGLTALPHRFWRGE